MATEKDNDTLKQALDKTLKDVDHWRISADQIDIDKNVELGKGGFSTVYAAKFVDRSGRMSDAAVKVLRVGLNNKALIHVAVALARELRVWVALHHPNVLPLLGFYLDMEQGTAWIISPRMPFGNVLNFFKVIEPDFGPRLQAAQETADALAYLHEQDPPICHGDLKPDNLLINGEGHIVLSDFGLTVIPDATGTGLTTTKSLKGATRYLAPELLQAAEPMRTLKSDIWAFGCVVAELLTGEPPYANVSSDISVAQKILKGLLPSRHLNSPKRFLRWTCALQADARPSIRQCRLILSNPFPAFLLSDSTGYNDRDLEAPTYGEACSMDDDPRWMGWVAKSAHRSCRLSPVLWKGGFDIFFKRSLVKVFSSVDGLSFGFLYKSSSGYWIDIYNPHIKDMAHLDMPHVHHQSSGCTADLRYFGALSTYLERQILRIWHIASKACVLEIQLDAIVPEPWRYKPEFVHLPRAGLCILVGKSGAILLAYGDRTYLRVTVVYFSKVDENWSVEPHAKFTADNSHFAILGKRDEVLARTTILFFKAEGLLKIGELKITGINVQDFVLAGDGKSVIFVDATSSETPGRTPTTLFHCDLTSIMSPSASSSKPVECPIRCIASRINGNSSAGQKDPGPIIRISHDGSYAVAAESSARTVLDLQTGLILREFWIEEEASTNKKRQLDHNDFRLNLDKFSHYLFKYDVDPPCPRNAEECSYHDWHPVAFAGTQFVYSRNAIGLRYEYNIRRRPRWLDSLAGLFRSKTNR